MREHNNASGAATELAAVLGAAGARHVFHNDSTARAFVAAECPRALAAYDCLRPPAFKADLWRYCVLLTKGGVYLDAEDAPLVPLASLLRPCDTLVLARDFCPDWRERQRRLRQALAEGGARAMRATALPPCNLTAVQISFMAAAPGHPLLRCALERVVRNVRRGHYGRGDLFVSGPGVAGHCLRALHRRVEYTMELSQGHSALLLDGKPVIRTHELRAADYNAVHGYHRSWDRRRVFEPRCRRRNISE